MTENKTIGLSWAIIDYDNVNNKGNHNNNGFWTLSKERKMYGDAAFLLPFRLMPLENRFLKPIDAQRSFSVIDMSRRMVSFTDESIGKITSWKWDFGDGSPYSYAQVPTHTYATDGNYMVRVLVSSICGTAVDSLGAHILGINDLDLGQDELNVYPNPTRDQATIVNKASGVRMESVTVYSLLGRKVYSAKADSPLKHGLSLKSLSSGMYTIRIQTNKGMVVRKLELIK